jgi:4-hydroxy-tetrahydrodipicolinate synthase
MTTGEEVSMSAMSRASGDDPFWVPILTHYQGTGRPAVDPGRMAAHIASLRPHLRQFMLAGSTGDGWELDDEQFRTLIDLAHRADVFDGDCRILFGALRPTTDEVITRAVEVESRMRHNGGMAAAYAGLAVCPPVDPAADQTDIIQHYDAVLAATLGPIAIYQLPQVTGCAIAPETLRDLAALDDRITLFKDSSGPDAVARSGIDLGKVVLVRGAEGNYAEALSPEGPYDGWLLSTGNVFARRFRAILDYRDQGDMTRARALSDETTAAVERLFDAAGAVPFGNAFSNANRAGDHIRAYGGEWRSAPAPLTISGHRLPAELLAAAAEILEQTGDLPERGYL